MTNEEARLFNIIKSNKDKNNWDIVRSFYSQQYNIDLPELRGMPTIWTVESWIRLLKQTYPSELTSKEERQQKQEMESNYKEMAKPDNRPVKAPEQGSLGLFGEPSWWD